MRKLRSLLIRVGQRLLLFMVGHRWLSRFESLSSEILCLEGCILFYVSVFHNFISSLLVVHDETRLICCYLLILLRYWWTFGF